MDRQSPATVPWDIQESSVRLENLCRCYVSIKAEQLKHHGDTHILIKLIRYEEVEEGGQEGYEKSSQILKKKDWIKDELLIMRWVFLIKSS